jgi:hypothetical protein
LSFREKPATADDGKPDPLATRLNMHASYPTPEGRKFYNVRHVPGGFSVMF